MKSKEIVANLLYNSDRKQEREKLQRVLEELCQQRQGQQHVHEGSAVAHSLAKDLVMRHLEVVLNVLHHQLLQYLDLIQ